MFFVKDWDVGRGRWWTDRTRGNVGFGLSGTELWGDRRENGLRSRKNDD